jgi:hypothetical protein
MAPAWSLVRGTSTRQPYSARDSHQDSSARSPTSAPTVTMSGPSRSEASAAIVAMVPCTVFWVVVVPLAVTATGVCAAMPCSVSAEATSGRCEAVACSTNVPGAAARRAQSTPARTSASRCADPSGTPA